MKRFIYSAVTAAILLSGTVITACSNDDNKNEDVIVGKEYIKTLRKLYPSAKNIEWERKSGYTIAEFRNDRHHETEVWLDDKAEWVMTATDFDRDITQLPLEVITAWEHCDYSSWTVDDVELYQRRDGNYYIIEVEKQGQPDTDLVFLPEGVLTAVRPNTYGEITPLTPFL